MGCARVISMLFDAIFPPLFLSLAILAAVIVLVWHVARLLYVLLRWWQGPPPPPEPDNVQKALNCIENAIARGEHLKLSNGAKETDKKRRD